jgi:hypothetical protein
MDLSSSDLFARIVIDPPPPPPPLPVVKNFGFFSGSAIVTSYRYAITFPPNENPLDLIPVGVVATIPYTCQPEGCPVIVIGNVIELATITEL